MSLTHIKAHFGRAHPFRWVIAMCTVATGWPTLHAVANTTPDSIKKILERGPFGPPPAPPQQIVTPEETEPVIEEDPYIIPPGLESIKVTLLSRFNGIPAAGFTDEASNTPYYLLEGQSFEEFNLVNVDLQKATVRLRRGAYETELPLWINPATTNQADVATFGMPPGSTPPVVAKAPAIAAPRTRTLSPDEQKRIEELRQRREEARLQREEQRKAHAEEMAKLTPAERQQRLRDINVDIIINDSGPPLPIELDEKDLTKLHDAGFEVPGFDKK